MRKIFTLLRNIFGSSSLKKLFIVLWAIVFSSCFAAESDGMQTAIEVLNVIFAMVSAIMTPAVILAGWLLTPDWTMGDFFGLRPYFLKIWILVSNLVYIAFALILLYLAVMQIFAGEDAEYTFKKRLPKFLVGILMVPFTWLIVSWTLSFANQATAAVLAVPMGAISSFDTSTEGAESENKWLFHDKVIPTTININLTDSWKKTRDCSDNPDSRDGTACISAAEFVKYNGSGPFFIIMVYAYDIFRIQSTDLIPLSEKCSTTQTKADDCIKKLVDVVVKAGTWLIITFFFWVLTIALCWVLVMRAFKLWIYVMFSPLFGLAYFFDNGFDEAFHSEWGGGHGGGDSGMSKLGFIPFLKLAMVPVIVAWVLSFGLLFIGAINQTFSVASMTASSGKQSNGDICTAEKWYMVRYCITPDTTKVEWSTSKLIVGNNSGSPNGKDYTIKFEFGNTFSGFLGDKSASGVLPGVSWAIDSVESIFAHVLLTLISLVIIWMGIKAAVSYDEVTKVAFAPFEKLGDSVQHFAMELPSHLPLPHPAFALATQGWASAAADMLNAVTQGMKDDQRKSLTDIMNGASNDIKTASENFKNGTGTFSEFVDKFGKLQFKDFKEARTTILEGLNKVENDVPADKKAAFTAFKADIEKASSKDQLKDALNKHADIVALLDGDTVSKWKLKGIGKLASQFEATSASSSTSSSSSSFKPDATLKDGVGSVGSGVSLKKDTSGNLTVEWELTPDQRKAIENEKANLKNPNNAERRKALERLNIKVEDDDDAGKVSDALIKKAGF